MSHFKSCQPPAFSLPKPSSYRWVLPQLYRLSLQPGFQSWWLYVPSPVSVLTHAVWASPLPTPDVLSVPLSGGGDTALPLYYLHWHILVSFLWIPYSRNAAPIFDFTSPFSSRLKACFHLMFQISPPSSHLLSWLLAPGCLISWIIRWMRSPPWPCAHPSAKMPQFPPALLFPFLFCCYIKKKKMRRAHSCLQPPLKGCVCAQSLHSCPAPCDPTNCSPPSSSVMGLSRQEDWIG